jgi:hypothetical protein
MFNDLLPRVKLGHTHVYHRPLDGGAGLLRRHIYGHDTKGTSPQRDQSVGIT